MGHVETTRDVAGPGKRALLKQSRGQGTGPRGRMFWARASGLPVQAPGEPFICNSLDVARAGTVPHSM